jgi:mycothiol synthase
MDDLDEAVALFNRCDGPVAGPSWHSGDEMKLIWTDPDLAMSRDVRVVRTADGRMIGYMQVWAPEPRVRFRLWGRVHPEHEGRGIGTALFTWGESLARARMAEAPPGSMITLQAWCFPGQPRSERLLAGHGLSPTRHSLNMAIDLGPAPPQATWPDGIELRPYLPDHLRLLYAAHCEAFRDHRDYAETDFETGLERFRHFGETDQDPALWFIAWERDEIAAFALCRAVAHEDPEMAWVDDIAVRRPWRRRGLATALLLHAFAQLRARGRPRVGLSVDAASLTGATRLYEKVGMRTYLQCDIHEKRLRDGRNLETTELT